MKRIYKFPVEVADVFGVRMPVGAEVLHVGTQRGRPVMWADEFVGHLFEVK